MRKVLVVDDIPAMRTMLGFLVRKHGYDVDTAQHGQEAVDKHEPGKYFAILMDIRMPVMDGLEAARRIRRRDPQVAIIAVPAADDLEGDCREAQMNAFLPKPVDPETLRQTLEGFSGQAPCLVP